MTNLNIAQLNHTVMQMTSVQIAEITNTEHRNVKISIERLMKKEVIQLTSMTKVENKQSLSPNKFTNAYIFTGEQGKRDSIIVVAQLCPEFTAKLVDRWKELEEQVAQPRELSRLEILQLALEAEQQNIALQQQVKVLEPKAEALDKIANTDHTYTIRECAKTIGYGERKLIQLLLDKGWVYRDQSKRLQAYSHKCDQGVFINRPSSVITNRLGEENIYLQMRVTAYGLTRITGLVNKAQKVVA